MNTRTANFVGKRFGRLVVLSLRPERGSRGRRYWECQCDCGGTTCTRTENLLRGKTQSCGCLQAEHIVGVGHRNKTHGATAGNARATEYRIWEAMIARCHTPTTRIFPKYGGRGISVCQRWRDSFEAFLADVGSRPSRQHSLDRINNNGNYEPGNVRWATAKQQARNTRSNKIVEFRGERMPIAALAERCGLAYSLLQSRLKYGWSVEDAIARPIANRGQA